jgi:hypothetical protein
MAALQAANPGRVVAVPGAMVAECLECLEEIATSDAQACFCGERPCIVCNGAVRGAVRVGAPVLLVVRNG